MGVTTTREPTCYTIRYPGYNFGFTNNKTIISKVLDWQDDTAESAEIDRWHVSASRRPFEEQIASRHGDGFVPVQEDLGSERPDFITKECEYNNLELADY